MDEIERSDKLFANDIRIKTIHEMGVAGRGHVGGAMSMTDAVAVLYNGELKCDPANPRWEGRDWLVCSKGHSGPAIYAALAIKGFFPMEWLETLNKPHTKIPSHVDRNKVPGIDASTGSLGQGLSMACGIAAAHKQTEKDNIVYVITGDGELQEGQIWEAAMFAAHNKLDNIIVFVDNNKGQLDGQVANVDNIEDLEAKFGAFGWYAQRINGHETAEIRKAVANAKACQGKPSVIILETEKGHGCTFAVGGVFNHHVYITPDQEKEAIEALELEREALLKA